MFKGYFLSIVITVAFQALIMSLFSAVFILFSIKGFAKNVLGRV